MVASGGFAHTPSGPFSLCHPAILRLTRHSRGKAVELFSQLSRGSTAREFVSSNLHRDPPAYGRGPREGASALSYGTHHLEGSIGSRYNRCKRSGGECGERRWPMRRFILLVAVVLVMTATLVLTMAPALAGPAWGVPVEPATACNTVAGVAGFEWRAGGEVCWFTLPIPPPQ
jgi:hypothetical protein